MRSLVPQFIDAMSIGLERRSQNPGKDVWPAPKADLALADDYSGRKLLTLLEEIFNSNNDITSIAKYFYRPSRVAYLMYLFFLRPNNLSEAKKRMELANNMLHAISFLRNGDPFCDTGKNNVFSQEQYIQYAYSLTPVNNATEVNSVILLGWEQVVRYMEFILRTIRD